MLAAAGRLDRTPFGPPVPVVEDAVGQVARPTTTRRAAASTSRCAGRKPVSFLAAFDAPAMAVNCDRRTPARPPRRR